MNKIQIIYNKIKHGDFFNSLLRKIEFFFASNHLNLLATLYCNFRLLKISQAIRFPIFVYGRPKFISLHGRVVLNNQKKSKMGIIEFNSNYHVLEGPNNSGTDSEFNIWGTIVFKGTCKIGTSCKICVRTGGILEFGDACHIMPHCNITAYSSITIGNNLRMAHRSQILDTNYHYIADLNKKRIKRFSTPIHIGDYVWLCNNSTITGGVSIPNRTIIASNSLVNKTIADLQNYSIIGGQPAKLISVGFDRIYDEKFASELDKYFEENPNEMFYSLED